MPLSTVNVDSGSVYVLTGLFPSAGSRYAGVVLRTFHVQALGCRVSGYEGDEMARFLVGRGLVPSPLESADLRIVHTCSVTQAAAADSRRLARKAVRLSVLGAPVADAATPRTPMVVVSGCWASSDTAAAKALPGIDAVVTHQDNWRTRLHQLLRDRGEVVSIALPQVGVPTPTSTAPPSAQPSRQRTFLKIQDGCDAHCTYCIIPRLRPELASMPIDDAVREARQRVAEGHVEIVLTGIFLGAYGYETALHRRQTRSPTAPLARLVEALCTRVPGLLRLRLSSLEPGDMDASLIAALASFPQVVPHFHLPLQSGSDAILRRMNRQYTQGHYLDMVGQLKATFDRPAITTDIITGFPGETEDDFAATMDVARQVGFLDVHAFPYSPRPQTAAARWTESAIPEAVRNRRLARLVQQANEHRSTFIRCFIGEQATVVVERNRDTGPAHGRCERYFDVRLDQPAAPGEMLTVEITGESAGRADGRVLAANLQPVEA